ncbi:MAG: hypothetical protein ACREV6_07380 [Clostridium sp.]|uniref:hypothetical protein n=1 Tax=Clostridium sp. TaxID=1506 RepID=UPI003D6CC249
MNRINRKEKYCLKGEYYEALEVINSKLMQVVPNLFRNEVYSDLIDLFYRNQSQGKSFSEAIGSSIDDFVAEIVDTYYSTLSIRKWIGHLFQNALLLSLICTFFYIVNSLVTRSSVALSFATIIISAIGFISGLICFYCNYKIVYKLKGWTRSLVQLFLQLTPMYIVIFGGELIYNLTQDIVVSKKLIMGMIILQILLYVVLKLSYRFNGKREQNGN